MKLLVRTRSLFRFLRAAEVLLLVIGAFALCAGSYIWLDAVFAQRHLAAQFDHEFAAPLDHPATGSSSGQLGRLEIPRLGVSVIVLEGVGRLNLRRALGHILHTALPGQPGNIGISGHRDTFFRPLRHIQLHDTIVFTTPAGGRFRYRVVSTRVVPPTDMSVLAAADREVLTLITCYPFYFVGPAPDRFVVRAERIA